MKTLQNKLTGKFIRLKTLTENRVKQIQKPIVKNFILILKGVYTKAQHYSFIKHALIFTITITLIYSAFHHLLGVESDYQNQLSDSQQHFFHEFEELTRTNTDANGQITSIIHSDLSYYNAAKQTTLMSSPHITKTRKSKSPVTITALTAEINHKNGVTTLKDSVNVMINDGQNIHINTEELTLDNAKQLAKTDLPATISHSQGIMHGIGLEFKFDTNKIKFLQNVRGTYGH